MKTTQLNRVINLIARTGDKAIVMDRDTDEVLVMMSLENYEDLLDGAEPADFAKDWEDEDGDLEPEFGNDIASWAAANDRPRCSGECKHEKELVKHLDEVATPEPAPVKMADHTLEFGDDWVKKEINKSGEESLAEVPNDEDENQFYLEPV